MEDAGALVVRGRRGSYIKFVNSTTIEFKGPGMGSNEVELVSGQVSVSQTKRVFGFFSFVDTVAVLLLMMQFFFFSVAGEDLAHFMDQDQWFLFVLFGPLILVLPYAASRFRAKDCFVFTTRNAEWLFFPRSKPSLELAHKLRSFGEQPSPKSVEGDKDRTASIGRQVENETEEGASGELQGAVGPVETPRGDVPERLSWKKDGILVRNTVAGTRRELMKVLQERFGVPEADKYFRVNSPTTDRWEAQVRVPLSRATYRVCKVRCQKVDEETAILRFAPVSIAWMGCLVNVVIILVLLAILPPLAFGWAGFMGLVALIAVPVARSINGSFLDTRLIPGLMDGLRGSRVDSTGFSK